MKNNQGVALIVVLTSITLLTTILINFKFDTHINVTKVYNKTDKYQARLNAESGLIMGMARLQLYKEARNRLEKNPKFKKNFPSKLLNSLYELPFRFPIPIPGAEGEESEEGSENINLIQKETITEFNDKSLLPGSLTLTIMNSSNLININMLRIHLLKDTEKKTTSQNNNNENNNNNNNNEEDEDDFRDDENTDENQKTLLNVEKKLTELLKTTIEKKKETDEAFALKYENLEPDKLIKKLKYFVNPENSYEDDFIPEIQSEFEEFGIKPKFAAISSISELYLIPGWNDDIVDLFKNEITVHGSFIIDLNKITDKFLRFMFPELDDESIKAFFKYRDNPDEGEPKYFESISDFKKFFIDEALIDSTEFDGRIEEFRKAGIQFGGSSNVFKILSVGQHNRASYSITAWSIIPVKPPPPPPPKKKEDNNSRNGQTSPNFDPTKDQNDQNTKNPTTTKKKKKRVIQFLNPRIIELYGY